MSAITDINGQVSTKRLISAVGGTGLFSLGAGILSTIDYTAPEYQTMWKSINGLLPIIAGVVLCIALKSKDVQLGISQPKRK